MWKKTNRITKILLVLAVLIALGVALYFVPPIHAKLAWRLENLQTTIYYFFHPPQAVVFVPTQQSLLTQTVEQPTTTTTPTPTPLPTEAATPTITLTPVPQSVVLDNVTFIDQMNRWNYCGPANLAMALTYWGWTGEPGNTMQLRDQIAAVVKPGVNDPSLDFIQRSQTDVNVMPYELVNYVNDYTTLKALWRVGGDVDLLKRLIAAGFPVVVEKGIYQTLPPEQTLQWAGHYSFTTGYDDSQQTFTWQDAYTPDENIPFKDQGFNVTISYEEYIEGWRAFDYLFIIIYPPEREADLFQLLGNWTDEGWAAQHALEIAEEEIQTLTNKKDLFFAWFNKGTNYGLLTDYGNSAVAYDNAFTIYNEMDEADRPYRIMWYQTGPYKAYYYTSRYQDVINRADATEATLYSHRVIEETLYYRALAEAALGYYDDAYADMRKAVQYNPNFQLARDVLAQWGISPE